MKQRAGLQDKLKDQNAGTTVAPTYTLLPIPAHLPLPVGVCLYVGIILEQPIISYDLFDAFLCLFIPGVMFYNQVLCF
jgi:hypothetical protein